MPEPDPSSHGLAADQEHLTKRGKSSPPSGAKMKARARREFDAWAGSFDRSMLNFFLFRPAYRVLIEEVARWRAGHDGRLDILDVGCGTGTFVWTLAHTTWHVKVIGLDYSSAMCATATGKTADSSAPLGRHPRFVTGDSEHLPFDTGSFDIVTCANSFHHYPHQQMVIREMRRVLRPGGRLIIIDGFRDNVIGWFVFDVCIAMIEGDVHHVPWSRMRRYFQEAGLWSIRQRKFSFWFPALATLGDR